MLYVPYLKPMILTYTLTTNSCSLVPYLVLTLLFLLLFLLQRTDEHNVQQLRKNLTQLMSDY